jgi:hypothetical protein
MGRAVQPPILPCTGLGFSCRRPCGAARWALTPPFHYHPPKLQRSEGGLLVFCDTFRPAGIDPTSPDLSGGVSVRRTDTARQLFSAGILPCGVRTFLSVTNGPGIQPSLGIKEHGATISPEAQHKSCPRFKPKSTPIFPALSTSQLLNLSTSQPLNLSTSQPLNLSTSQPLNARLTTPASADLVSYRENSHTPHRRVRC